MILKIQNLDKFVKELQEKYLKYQRQNQKWWADRYFGYYEQANKVLNSIEGKAVKIENGGYWGKIYHVDIKTIREYQELYKFLASIPKSEIKIFAPESFFVTEKRDDFYQIED